MLNNSKAVKRLEKEKIQQENQRILSKLQSKKSHYNFEKLEEDEEKRQQILRRMSHLPHPDNVASLNLHVQQKPEFVLNTGSEQSYAINAPYLKQINKQSN